MAIDKVKEYFKKYNIENRIIELDKSSATVKLAAEALNTTESRIAKSISLKVKNQIILIVSSGDCKIDNTKFKNEFKEKPRMLNATEVETFVGHSVGGVCPFAINSNVLVYLDDSLKRFETVFPACGSSNSVIELTINELEKYSNYQKWVDVCKLKD